MSDNGKEEKSHLGTINLDGKDVKIINEVTVIEIKVLKLEGGREITQTIAREFLMTDHKPYMIKLLTTAIDTVMKAVKRKSPIKILDSKGLNFLKRKLGKGAGRFS